MRDLIILGGNPGSGKTTISRLLEQYGFEHLSIDDFYQQTPRTPEIKNWFEDQTFLDQAYASFRKEIFDALDQDQHLVIETTGVGNRWKELVGELESKYKDRLIKIYLDTSRETSTQRIAARNETDYPIKMSEERLDAFFQLGKDTSSGYSHVIDANGAAEDLVQKILELVK